MATLANDLVPGSPRDAGTAPAPPASGGAGFSFPSYQTYRKAWDDSATVDPTVPLCIDLELASLCGLRCPMCFWGDSGFQADMNGSSPVMARQLMPTQLALRLIDEASAMGVPSLKFHGRGDGIHHREYNAILSYARAKGGFWELLVNTHGNCAKSKVDGLMCADKVMVSLDSVRPTTYAQMRAGGRLGDVIWTVEELVRRGHRNVWVRRVITDINLDEPFVDECRAVFGPKVKVSEHFAFNGRNAGRRSAIHGEDELGWGRQYCQYPSVRLMVTASGKVLPCCVDWRADMVVGDVGTQSLAQIWNGEPIRRLRSELRAGVLSSPACRNCTSFNAYRRPEREYVQDREGKAVLK